MSPRRLALVGVVGALLAIALVMGWSATAPGRSGGAVPSPEARRGEPAATRRVFPQAAPRPAPSGPIVRKVGDTLFADGARLGAPPFTLVVTIRADFVSRFGPAVPRPYVAAEEAALEDFYLIARNLAWVRDWSAIEDPSYDSSANQAIQLRVQVVIERRGGAEEMAYAVEGARVECERGLELQAPAGREAASACLDVLSRFEGR